MQISRFLLPVAVLGCAGHPSRPATRDDTQTLIDLEQQWVASYVAADAGYLRRLFADEAVFVSSSGVVTTGAQEIDELASGAVRYTRFSTWDLAPRVLGDTAYVTARSHVEGHVVATARDFVVDLRVLDVFVRRGAAWRLVASQATRVAP
jgi:ketosteroid isomerase-like protein